MLTPRSSDRNETEFGWITGFGPSEKFSGGEQMVRRVW